MLFLVIYSCTALFREHFAAETENGCCQTLDQVDVDACISNYARDTSFFGIYVTVLWLSFIYVFSPCFQHRYTSLVSHFPFLLFLDSPPMLHASMSACVLPGDDYNDIHTIWNRRYTRENGFCVQPMRSLSTTVSDACLFPFQCQLFFNRLFILTLVYAFPTDAASNNGGLL